MPQILSYDIQGSKESFANWVSNISPHETPFLSLTGKAPISNKTFEWQIDRLDNVWSDNAWPESSEIIPDPILRATEPQVNYVQIARKLVQVSDTVEALNSYGRGSELEYQIEKATKEIKRDLEHTFLSRQVKDVGSETTPRLTSGFYDLTASIDEAEPNTGAVTHKKLAVDTFTENDIFDITENLYYAGSRANTIMFHPSQAKVFSSFFEGSVVGRVAMYDNTDEMAPNALTEIVDPLGQRYTLLPNQWMEKELIYFFHPHDWFQRVLREPTASTLDKTGSTENWMLEIEVGLQHRHPWASGILELTYIPPVVSVSFPDVTLEENTPSPIKLQWSSSGATVAGTTFTSSNPSVATVDSSGSITIVSAGTTDITLVVEYPRGQTVTEIATVTILPFIATVTVTLPPNDWYKTANPLVATFDVGSNFSTGHTWSSSDDSIASIDPDSGVITVHTPGTVNFNIEVRFNNSIVKNGSGTFTASPSIVTKNPQNYDLRVGDSQDIGGLISVAPAEADALGYTYEVDPAITPYLTITGTTVTVIAQPPIGVKIGATVYANTEPLDTMFIGVNINGSAFTLDVTQPPVDVLSGDIQTVKVELGSALATNVFPFYDPKTSDVTITNVAERKIDDTHYEFDFIVMTSKATGSSVFDVYIQCTFPDGNNQKAFSNKVTAFDVQWTTPPPTNASAGLTFQTAAVSSDPLATISWSSANTNVISVNATGELSFLRAGQTSITVTATRPNGNTISTSSSVTVAEPTISWSPQPSGVMFEGQQVQYSYVTSDTPTSVVWESDHPEWATVSSTGLVEGVGGSLDGASTIATIRVTAKWGTFEKVLVNSVQCKLIDLHWVIEPQDDWWAGDKQRIQWFVNGPAPNVFDTVTFDPVDAAIFTGDSFPTVSGNVTMVKDTTPSVKITVTHKVGATFTKTLEKTVTVHEASLTLNPNKPIEIKDGLTSSFTTIPRDCFLLNGKTLPNNANLLFEFIPTADYPTDKPYIVFTPTTVVNVFKVADYSVRELNIPSKLLKYKVSLESDPTKFVELDIDIKSAHNMTWTPPIPSDGIYIANFYDNVSLIINNGSTSTITKTEWTADANIGRGTQTADIGYLLQTGGASGGAISLPQTGAVKCLVTFSDNTVEHMQYVIRVR